MIKENKLTNVIQKVRVEDLNEDCIIQQLKSFKKIHSYIAYGSYDKNDELIGWQINYNISQNDKFNTLSIEQVASNIWNDLPHYIDADVERVQSYLQPSLSLLLRQYKPLIVKLSKETRSRWEFLEMEDLIQMCNLVICDLYYKNYYIHKQLIRRSFNNYVLMHIRKNKNRPSICSLEQLYHKSDSDSDVTFAEMIPDTKLLQEEEDKYNCEVQMQIIKEMRDIVVDFIGQRQYDQLLREYGNKQTTPWSRKLMGKIKAHMFDMGITLKSFNKYYG
jgi:hypothetical protein